MSFLDEMSKRRSKHQVVEIEIDKIIPDPNQPRKTFTGLKELASTIVKHGLQNPIHVREGEGKKYIIISGERRWRSCKEHTNLKVIPCFIHKESDQKTIGFLQLIENLQREELPPLEEALAYKKLLDEAKLKQKELASELGVGETVISKTLRLASLPKEIQEEIKDYPKIAKSLLLEIAKEKDTRIQFALWDKMKTGELTKTKDVVRERKESKGMKKKDLESLDSKDIWGIIMKAKRKDPDIIKKLLNAKQFEKLISEE